MRSYRRTKTLSNNTRRNMGKPGGAVVVSESDPEKILNGLDLLKERLAGTGGRFKTLEATQDNITCDDADICTA
jgi:hypothetical protein